MERVRYHEVIRPARDWLGLLGRQAVMAASRWSMRTRSSGRETLRARGVQVVVDTIQAASEPTGTTGFTTNSEARKRLLEAGNELMTAVEANRAPGYRTAEYVAFIERGGQAPRREEAIIPVSERNFGSMGEEVL